MALVEAGTSARMANSGRTVRLLSVLVLIAVETSGCFQSEREREHHQQSDRLILEPTPWHEPIEPLKKHHIDRQMVAEFVADCTKKSDAEACFLAGWNHYQGEVVERDAHESVKLLLMGCRLGSMLSCSTAGQVMQWEGISSDGQSTALSLHIRACEGGYPEGCEYAAMACEGMEDCPIAQSVSSLYSKACDGGVLTSCATFADMNYLGQGVERDVMKALRLHTQTCRKGQMHSCYQAGVIDTELGFYDLAKEMFEQPCAKGDPASCFNLGHFASHGLGGEIDLTAAVQYYQRACDGGQSEGCEVAKGLSQAMQ